MGNVEEECEAALTRPLPEVVVIRRRVFNQYLMNRSFSSWEAFVEAVSAEPQGTSESVVKCDPLDICSWVATFLIQSCIWGLVAFFADQSIFIGILLSASYGILLWLCVDQWLPPRMAGMLWPNLPVTVAVVGALVAVSLQGVDATPLTVFFCSILPAIAATVFWMRRLPEEPDRAPLVVNLFFGLWAMMATFRMGGDDMVPSYVDFLLLFLLGCGFTLAAVQLFRSPGRWGSVELVTWTLNVGVLGVALGTVGLLILFSLENSKVELLLWFFYILIHGLLGFLGLQLGRSFPVLLSALAAAAVSVRMAMVVEQLTGSTVAGICSYGLLGFLVIATLWIFRPKDAEGRQVYQ